LSRGLEWGLRRRICHLVERRLIAEDAKVVTVQVVGFVVFVWPGLAERRKRGHDEARVKGLKALIPQTQGVKGARFLGFDEDVCILHQCSVEDRALSFDSFTG